MNDIIKKPVITEKAMKLQTMSQYVFDVDVNANKIEIKKTLEKMFEVDIKSIRTVNVKGKSKSRFTKKGVMRSVGVARKKAYITLEAGQTIELVSGAGA